MVATRPVSIRRFVTMRQKQSAPAFVRFQQRDRPVSRGPTANRAPDFKMQYGNDKIRRTLHEIPSGFVPRTASKRCPPVGFDGRPIGIIQADVPIDYCIFAGLFCAIRDMAAMKSGSSRSLFEATC